MKEVILGTSGAKVSEICLGTLHFSSNTPDDISRGILNAYAEAGGRFLDTANIYNSNAPNGKGGESERLIGRWMKGRKNREKVFLATKVGMVYPGQEPGLRAHQIEAECRKSLRRLGVETIDLYYAHTDDRTTPLEETLAAFDRLVAGGLVRFVGASNFQPTRLVESLWTSRVNGWAPYCCIQQRYSYLRPRPGANFGRQAATDDDLVDFCRRHSFPLIGYAPALKGAVASRPDKKLNSRYAGEDSDARLAVLNEVSREMGVTPVQLTLAWMRHHEATVIPLIGASTEIQLKESLGALDIELDGEIIARLNP